MRTADYRSADQLPEGAVLVVGSAQSGVQIAESLIESGRNVYLSTSKVGRVRRRYRGKDLTEWAVITGMAEQTVEDLDDPAQAKAPQPQISGRHGGETLSLQSLEARGVVLLGRLASYQEGLFHFSDNLPENINFADQVSQGFCKTLDDTIEALKLTVAPVEADPADNADTQAEHREIILELSAKETGISSVIWSTGFDGNFDWLKCAARDEYGIPIHHNGISPQSGLYFCGFPWLRNRISGLICGAAADAEFIAGKIARG